MMDEFTFSCPANVAPTEIAVPCGCGHIVRLVFSSAVQDSRRAALEEAALACEHAGGAYDFSADDAADLAYKTAMGDAASAIRALIDK
jgi:hypothetical protein